MPDALLTVRGVEAGYGRIRALNGIDLEVRRGEIVTLLGANGAGKTTTLKTISGLVRASAGSIKFEGQELIGHKAMMVVYYALRPAVRIHRESLAMETGEGLVVRTLFGNAGDRGLPTMIGGC